MHQRTELRRHLRKYLKGKSLFTLLETAIAIAGSIPILIGLADQFTLALGLVPALAFAVVTSPAPRLLLENIIKGLAAASLALGALLAASWVCTHQDWAMGGWNFVNGQFFRVLVAGLPLFFLGFAMGFFKKDEFGVAHQAICIVLLSLCSFLGFFGFIGRNASGDAGLGLVLVMFIAAPAMLITPFGWVSGCALEEFLFREERRPNAT